MQMMKNTSMEYYKNIRKNKKKLKKFLIKNSFLIFNLIKTVTRTIFQSFR